MWFSAVEVTAEHRFLIALLALEFMRSVESKAAGNLTRQLVVLRPGGDDKRPASPVIRFRVARLCRAGSSQGIKEIRIDVVSQFAAAAGQ